MCVSPFLLLSPLKTGTSLPPAALPLPAACVPPSASPTCMLSPRPLSVRWPLPYSPLAKARLREAARVCLPSSSSPPSAGTGAEDEDEDAPT